MTLLLTMVGFVFLVGGAELLVCGSVRLAVAAGISPLVVHQNLIRLDVPIMIGAAILMLLLAVSTRATKAMGKQDRILISFLPRTG